MGQKREENLMATRDISELITKFSIPAIISGLVGAIYNIVDQIFIGQYVGMLGNAATNIAFPITTISTSLALLLGVGTASNFSLALGRQQEEKANTIVGNGLSAISISGIILAIIFLVFLNPLLKVFGATPDVMPYALDYTRIIALGLPFFIFSNAGSHIIRADGDPNYAMFSILVGAILNIALDALFIITFKMGMKGAALATIIGQFVSSILVFLYFRKPKNVELTIDTFKIRGNNIKAISALGASACFNQLALTIFQITMNNSLAHYGALSKYGSEIPLAAVGVISKVYVIFISVVVGIAQGSQPIFGFNYGAEKYKRVEKTFVEALKRILIFSIICFIIFQLLPRPILKIFGGGNELYYEFGTKYFKTFMFMIFLNGIQPLAGNFFSAIDKARLGIFVSLTRQIIFLVPLIIILPRFLGIDGIMYAGPIADSISAILAIVLIRREFKSMEKIQEE